jgi:general nucleoside transport system permease protein
MEAFLIASISASIPMLFGSLGAIINEKAGLLNLGVEGIMMVGGMSAYVAARFTNNPLLAILIGMLSGVLMSLLFGFLTISLRINQSVTGLTLATFGVGLANTFGRSFIGQPISQEVAVWFNAFKIPILGDIPILGKILFNQDIFVYAGYLMVIVLTVLFKYSKFGLYLKAIGDHPAAADSLGINVTLWRYTSVMVSGAIISLGGAYITLSYMEKWLTSITMGRGWIAVALVIFAAWKPWRAWLGALLFGMLSIIQFYFKLPFSEYFIVMAPYFATIVVLILMSNKQGKHKPPLALGIPYFRENR